jgi:hypothetical protein
MMDTMSEDSSSAEMVVDVDRYAKVNGRRLVKLNGQIHWLRQFSVNQALAFMRLDENDPEAQQQLVDALVDRLTVRATGEKIDPQVVGELEQDTFSFLSDLLLTPKARKKGGQATPAVAAAEAEILKYSVPEGSLAGDPGTPTEAAGLAMVAQATELLGAAGSESPPPTE